MYLRCFKGGKEDKKKKKEEEEKRKEKEKEEEKKEKEEEEEELKAFTKIKKLNQYLYLTWFHDM